VAELDRFLPSWDVNELHETVLDTSPERALAAALAAPGAPDAIVRALFRLRGLRWRDTTVESLLLGIGLRPLARVADEVVFGAAGRPWRAAALLRPFDDAGAGTVRVAANFRVEPLPGGRTRLSTETRVAAVDDDARRAFRRYWLVVGPFSALIRRRWLAAARRRLE
jgi:hypothetical protein